MKKEFITILSVAIILSACISNSTQSSAYGQTKQSDIQLPNNFYKKFTGSIGEISIVMDLTKKDSMLTGKYYYTKVGIPLDFYGSINSDGKFDLSERNHKYEETGKFTGTFSSSGIISGTWTNPKTKKTLPFNLSEKTENLVPVSFYSRYSENCTYAEKNKKQRPADDMFWDTLCITFSLDLILVSSGSIESSQKINDTIKSIVCSLGYDDNKYSTFEELMNSVNTIEEDSFSYDRVIKSSLITNDNNILSISIDQLYSSSLSAHPTSGILTYNFDTRTGNQISLDDLLIKNYERTLNQIAEKKFVEMNGSDGWDFEKGNFELNRNFAITPGGLLFTFNQYEIGPYAMGRPEVFIQYKDIDNLIKPNGLLERWRKQ